MIAARKKPRSVSPKRLLANEQQRDQDLFEATPVLILKRISDCYNENAERSFPVPEHVLVALVKRARTFLDQGLTLEEAFGGQTASQRRTLDNEQRNFTVAFRLLVLRDEIRGWPRADRGSSTPHELACELLAEELETSAENVKKIYRASKAKSSRPKI